MNNELEDIILTIDTREQNQRRIKAVQEWAESLGAIVEHSKLELCDYALVGEFRSRAVNLGIEAKGWDNFLSDKIEDMEDKLVRSQELYSDVALFIETGNYTFKPQENGHCILNHSNPKLDLESKTLAAFEGFCATLQANGIQVRQLRSEAQFPYSIYNLLVYLQTPHKVKVKNLTYAEWLTNLYTEIPQIGYVRAKKLIDNYPNPFWLCSASEESLVQVMGKSTGQIAYQHLHNHRFETTEWKKGMHRDGTPKDEPSPEEQDDMIKTAIVDYLMGFPEGQTIEEICTHFNLDEGDPDRQEMHSHIKELAVEGRVTSVHKGLFIVPPADESDIALAYDGKPQRCREIPANKTDTEGNPLNPIYQDKDGQSAKSEQQSVPVHPSYPDADFSKVSSEVPPPIQDTAPVDNLPGKGSHIPPPPGDIILQDTTDKVPSDKKMSLTEHLKVWFQEPHTLMETQLMYGLEGKTGAWSSKSVFDAVMAGEKSGYLRVFSQKGERMYVVAVKAEKEMDIGV